MKPNIPYSQPNLPINKDVGPREWGSETLLHLAEGKWSMKKLFIKEGSKGGLHFHRLKDEAAFIVQGEMIVRHLDSQKKLIETILKAGDSIHFPPECIHQEEAITDCVLIEVSTPHANDRVRVESNFGIEINGGLPTTDSSDIINLTVN